MIATGSLTVAAPVERVVKAVEQLALDRGWSWQVDNQGILHLKTKASLLSWGEEVLVRLTSVQGETRVEIESNALAQILDWGKPQQNVQIVRAQVASLGVIGG